ncbi:MAG: tetratricopeptide repeat protein, partial [Gemmatimonadetes bacterium]|nr:tetratricopeptide repeat protein [Gemmatimonadota bacterium]
MAASEIEKLERLVKENPKGRLFASLADAYRKDGQYPKALEVLDAGLKNHPDYVSARVVLGRVYMATGDKAKAREAFGRVVELDPESVIALKALADLAEQDGESSEALRWSGQLLTVDPGNDEAIKQQERLNSAAKVHEEVRLSGIVPMVMADIAEIQAPVVEIHPPSAAEVGTGAVPTHEEPPAAAEPERTVAPFEAVKPPVVKTVEIPVVSTPSSRPSFNAVAAPLEQAPEPLPLMPLSEEAQTEQVASAVTPMAALEPTSFEGGGDAPTERLAGIDPVGLTAEEVAGIGATPGFEPNSEDIDTTDLP